MSWNPLKWCDNRQKKPQISTEKGGISAHKPYLLEWFEVAKMELGISEIKGEEDNPRIVEYHATTTLKAQDDETSWCSAFVNWCFSQCGIIGTRAANARSWMNWGDELLEPKKGCVVVFWREDRKSWKGHVGFYVSETETHIEVLGGNQGNQVSHKYYPKERLLGYRWPRGDFDEGATGSEGRKEEG